MLGIFNTKSLSGSKRELIGIKTITTYRNNPLGTGTPRKMEGMTGTRLNGDPEIYQRRNGEISLMCLLTNLAQWSQHHQEKWISPPF